MNFGRVFRPLALIAVAASLSLLFGGDGMVAPPAASAAFPGSNGKIAFAAKVYPSTLYEIWVMNADGTAPTKRTIGWLGGDSQPAWSADGSKIAFVRSVTANNHEILVVNADGTGAKALTNSSVVNDHPAWSPDGTKIAFTTYRGGNWEIYVMNAADGSGQTNLTNNAEQDSDPSWSPDGTKIAFSRLATSGLQGIWVMNADGTGQTMLTGSYAANYQPDWSPDGSQIAFTSSRDGGREIYKVNADGTGLTRLTTNTEWDEYPTWSPDGTKIAFNHGGDSQIYVMNTDGTGLTQLTSVGMNIQPSWGIPSPANVNQPPTVGAGGPYSGKEGAAIPLTGTASDPDSDPLTYSWSYAANSGVDTGATCTFSASTAKSTNFTCTDDGVYKVTLAANDSHNPAVSATADVTVSNVKPNVSITAPAAGALFKVGDTVTVSASFTDDGKNDTHSATIDWDDGAAPVAVSVTETAGSGSGTASGNKTFSSAGVYTAKAAVTDDDGGAGTATVMLVVYDPTAGFLTGSGWIDSLAGSYAPDPTLAGRANFGFVSKYQKGAATPVGQTEFQFQVANFSFYSDSYQWLVVAGPKAQYKGTGTVNGVSGYSFLLTATDGQVSGGGDVDKFRIKIWNTTDGTVVYDNVKGESDDVDSAKPQAVGGGSIVIHAK